MMPFTDPSPIDKGNTFVMKHRVAADADKWLLSVQCSGDQLIEGIDLVIKKLQWQMNGSGD